MHQYIKHTHTHTSNKCLSSPKDTLMPGEFMYSCIRKLITETLYFYARKTYDFGWGAHFLTKGHLMPSLYRVFCISTSFLIWFVMHSISVWLQDDCKIYFASSFWGKCCSLVQSCVLAAPLLLREQLFLVSLISIHLISFLKRFFEVS